MMENSGASVDVNVLGKEKQPEYFVTDKYFTAFVTANSAAIGYVYVRRVESDLNM